MLWFPASQAGFVFAHTVNQESKRQIRKELKLSFALGVSSFEPALEKNTRACPN